MKQRNPGVLTASTHNSIPQMPATAEAEVSSESGAKKASQGCPELQRGMQRKLLGGGHEHLQHSSFRHSLMLYSTPMTSLTKSVSLVYQRSQMLL